MAVDPGSCKGLPVSSESDSAGFALLEPCASSEAYELHELQTLTERADPSQASPCFGELMALDSCVSPPDKSPSMPILEIFRIRSRFQIRRRFQEPLLGRFDYAVGVTPPIEDEVPWGRVPEGTYEARRVLALKKQSGFEFF